MHTSWSCLHLNLMLASQEPDEGLLELLLYSFPYGVMLAKTLACFSALLG